MAATPQIKVYDADEKYQASTREIEAAAALMAFYGNGATIRLGHERKHIVWTEGAEEVSAGESYDAVVEVIHARMDARAAAYRQRMIEGSHRG